MADKTKELAAQNAKVRRFPDQDKEAAASDEQKVKRKRKTEVSKLPESQGQEQPEDEPEYETLAPVPKAPAKAPPKVRKTDLTIKPAKPAGTGVTTHISSDSLVAKVLEQKGGWARLVALIVEEIRADPEAYVFQGGLTAVKRRLKLLSADGLKVEHLKWFLATCEGRGHRIVNYAKKDDASGAQLKALNLIWKFKGKKGTDPVGSVSVIAAKVALPELFIAFREQMGPASFGGTIKYTGVCPVRYQWLGSLASMYQQAEENEATWATAIADYIEWYEDFQDWYISVRNAAAKVNNSNSSYTAPSAEDIDNALKKSRSYYHLALSSYSVNTRREWSRGNFSADVSQGVLLTQGEIATIIDQMYV
jgi:hypothetical protein